MHDRFLRFLYGSSVTRVLWVCTVLVFVAAEAQVVAAYLGTPRPHTLLSIGRLLVAVLIVSIPGIAGLKGYQVVNRLSSPVTEEKGKLIWLARQFLMASISAYIAISWRTW